MSKIIRQAFSVKGFVDRIEDVQFIKSQLKHYDIQDYTIYHPWIKSWYLFYDCLLHSTPKLLSKDMKKLEEECHKRGLDIECHADLVVFER